MISLRSFWQMIDEALNDSDDTELMSVVNSFAPEQWSAWAKEVLAEKQDDKTG